MNRNKQAVNTSKVARRVTSNESKYIRSRIGLSRRRRLTLAIIGVVASVIGVFFYAKEDEVGFVMVLLFVFFAIGGLAILASYLKTKKYANNSQVRQADGLIKLHPDRYKSRLVGGVDAAAVAGYLGDQGYVCGDNTFYAAARSAEEEFVKRNNKQNAKLEFVLTKSGPLVLNITTDKERIDLTR